MIDCSVDVTAIVSERLSDGRIVGQEGKRGCDVLDHPVCDVRSLVGLCFGAGGLCISNFDVGWTSQRTGDVADR